MSFFPLLYLPPPPLPHKRRTLGPHGNGVGPARTGWVLTTNDCAAVPVRSWKAYRNGSGAACFGLLADCHSKLGGGLSSGARMARAVGSVRGCLRPCRSFPFFIFPFPPFPTNNTPLVPVAIASASVERAVHGVKWQEHTSKWRMRWSLMMGVGRAESLALNQGRTGPV